MKSIFVAQNVQCPFSAAVPLIERFHDRSQQLRVGPLSFVEVTVDSALAQTRDYTDRTRLHEALVLQWRSHGLFPVPRFRGLITVRPNGAATEVRIDGHYVPPFGKIGSAFDALIGRRIARRTLERLMASIEAFIETQYGAVRMPHADR